MRACLLGLRNHPTQHDELGVKELQHGNAFAQRRPGPGGMGFSVLNSFIECIKRRVDFLMDAYDLATWHASTPLSEQFIQKGKVIDIPNFTNGKYKNRPPVFTFSTEY